MIRRHYLVEIKRVKELPLSTLSPPHHGPLPRITSQSDGITVRPWSQREFCNTFSLKADITPMSIGLRRVTVENKVASFDDLVAGKAGGGHRFVGGVAVVKVSEPPAPARGVFS